MFKAGRLPWGSRPLGGALVRPCGVGDRPAPPSPRARSGPGSADGPAGPRAAPRPALRRSACPRSCAGGPRPREWFKRTRAGVLPAARRRWGAPFWPPRAAAAELAWELGWTCVPARQPKGPAHARLSPGRSPPRDTGAMPQLCPAPWHPLTATPSRRGLETALLSAPVFPRLPPLGRPSPQAPSEPSARIPVPFRWRRTGAGFQPSAAPFASSRSRMALTQLVPRGRAPGPPSQPARAPARGSRRAQRPL